MISISDERILSLSFIFLINESSSKEGFINDCKQHESEIMSTFTSSIKIKIPGVMILFANEINNLRGDKKGINKLIAKEHAKHWDDDLVDTKYFNILSNFARHINVLEDSHIEQDHSCYEYFTKEIFKSTKYMKLKMSKHLTAYKDFIPDYKVAYEYKKSKILDLLIIEVKKEKKTFSPHASDKIKINLEMQIMLNEMIAINIEDPVVYGLLIQDHDCLLYELKLNYEAQYISKVVEVFYLPRDVYDISLLSRVTSIFLSIQNAVDELITKIHNRKYGNSDLLPYTRKELKLPKPLKDVNSFLDVYEAE